MSLIPAHTKDDALLADVAAADPAAAGGFCCWWLGQSGFLLKSVDGMLLLDPYLSDSLTVKYAATDKPHVRMSERVVDPARLTGLGLVTSSHNHTDHLDAETLGPLRAANPEAALVVPEANRGFVAERLGIGAEVPVGLDDGASAEVGPFTVHGIAAAHNTVDRDDAGRCRYLGYVIEFEVGGGRKTAVYHSGDTLWHGSLVEALSGFTLSLAMLPINGNLPTRRVSGNLWGQEAAALAKTVGAGCVVPCHYDMFTFNTQTPAAFVEACEAWGQPYKVLAGGERLDVAVR
ncbi:MAG: MBL fold metallo-hydrolase [Planctomycetota bacterium]